jgi:MerR family redox-sensitive transcriptional activator SoxR
MSAIRATTAVRITRSTTVSANRDLQLTIGQVARRAGIRTSAIRYYEGVGVLPEPERVAGRRRYGVDALRRLAIIDIAQRAGFSLEEIRHLLAAANGAAGDNLRELADAKLPAIEGLIERAQAVKRWLEAARACECSTLDVCALFDDRALGLPEQPLGVGALSVVKVSAGTRSP